MSATVNENNLLVYEGCNFFRQRLLLSTLSGKAIRIMDIRSEQERPGLRNFEISLVKLIEKISNGSQMELNKTGTMLYYQPGLLTGGTFSHDCGVERGIGYFLDILMALGPFCKTPLKATLKGVTNCPNAPSVDYVKSSGFQALKNFVIDSEELTLTIKRRGLQPNGGGEVKFTCPVQNKFRPIQNIDFGLVKRVRGIVYVCRASPTFADRTIQACKGVLLKFLPDVYINTDVNSGKQGGSSPGYGILISAETTKGTIYSAELLADNTKKGESDTVPVPEDIGVEVANKLLDEIYRGGCVDSTYQWLVALFMALGQKSVSKFLVGPLSQHSIYFLRHLREFFSITFNLQSSNDLNGDLDDELPGGPKVMLTCVGLGYSNINKRTY